MLTVVLVVVVVLLGLVSTSVRMVQQYERGVVLRFGRLLPTVRQPGLRLVVPIADQMRKVPIQTVVLDVPSQGTITRDNVTIGVDAVVYFRVEDPVRATINVDNYLQATSQVSQTSLRSVIGRADLDTLLADRDKINAELRDVIDAPTEDWGIHIDRVEIKDISLPEGMRRSMSAQAEAERDRRARVINADGELQASTKLSQAATAMDQAPGALQLRLLQTVTDVASENNSTLVMPVPVELLRFFEGATGTNTATEHRDPAERVKATGQGDATADAMTQSGADSNGGESLDGALTSGRNGRIHPAGTDPAEPELGAPGPDGPEPDEGGPGPATPDDQEDRV
ncbi:Regulator of protease activity HflC, stomatin/prohibitin superfamily [Pseudonocardia ammonioxydans]|uniref:Regulator of protease activity HflC, stomatin/prohibitin superfamily n=1 Tax=Pseudonocardia ammonioxydans TaxID=260086 RepID=A0A1I5IXC9_PSUAM|nr:Regulator of protease activity HflC, stomatin/prohibitin superfamily [Pseudonocardia ammonioxydans]